MRKTILTLVAVMAVLFASCGGGGSNEETVELPQVKSIEVSPKNVTLHIYEPTYLTAKIYPEGAEHSCSWDVQGDQFLLYVEDRGIDSLFILSEKLAEFDVVLYENISGLKDVCHVTITDDPVAVQRITLEQSELEVYEGGMCYLSATVFPFFATDSVKWKLEDQDIIVTSGENLINVRAGKRGIYVTAKKTGVSYVTATTKDGFVAKCKVTVKGVEQINLDKSEVELYKEQVEYITATVLPAKVIASNLTWSAENEDVVYVYDGNVDGNTSKARVIGRKTGTTNIVATSSDGKVVAKCKVTVKSNNQIDYHPYDDDTQW